MAYLKVWMGVTSGSHLGRNDGYPEKRFRVIDTIDDLVDSYDPAATYYKLSLMDIEPVVEAVQVLHMET